MTKTFKQFALSAAALLASGSALAATGAGKIIRRFPCVGGIDLAGTVTASSDPRFAKGDAVLATSYDIGVAHHGGYAGYGRVPADWVVPLPEGLSLFESMALGTAGYTAALGIVRMEENGLQPANGRVVVSGATGGVGSIAIDILARLGYEVVALTGKESQADYLKGLGAKEVMLRASLDLSKIKPLDKPLWAGAVDNLGGEVLASKLRRRRRTIGIAIGRFRNDVVEAGRRFRIRLQQLGVRADIAGGQHPQRLAAGAFAGKLGGDLYAGGIVAHPAVQAELLCQAPDKGPETDPLHNAFDADVLRKQGQWRHQAGAFGLV